MDNPEDSLAAFGDTLLPAQKDLLTSQTKEQFDVAFAAIISSAVRSLQSKSKTLNQLSEDGISDVFALTVNGSNVLIVSREEDSNGHVDLTFKADNCKPPRKVLGEAKIYKDYPWHEKGLKQLVEDYCTGTEERSLLLVYMKQPDIKGKMNFLRSKLDENLPCKQMWKCADHKVIWSFLTTHEHRTGEEVEVWHLGCDLFHPKVKAAKKSTSTRRRKKSPK